MPNDHEQIVGHIRRLLFKWQPLRLDAFLRVRRFSFVTKKRRIKMFALNFAYVYFSKEKKTEPAASTVSLALIVFVSFSINDFIRRRVFSELRNRRSTKIARRRTYFFSNYRSVIRVFLFQVIFTH